MRPNHTECNLKRCNWNFLQKPVEYFIFNFYLLTHEPSVSEDDAPCIGNQSEHRN